MNDTYDNFIKNPAAKLLMNSYDNGLLTKNLYKYIVTCYQKSSSACNILIENKRVKFTEKNTKEHQELIGSLINYLFDCYWIVLTNELRIKFCNHSEKSIILNVFSTLKKVKLSELKNIKFKKSID